MIFAQDEENITINPGGALQKIKDMIGGLSKMQKKIVFVALLGLGALFMLFVGDLLRAYHPFFFSFFSVQIATIGPAIAWPIFAVFSIINEANL